MSKTEYDLKKIRGFAFDVDGVLSPQTVEIGIDGEPVRKTNLHDGLAIRAAVEAGYPIVIITGAKTTNVTMRFHKLGVKDVFTGVSEKEIFFKDWMLKHNLAPEEVVYMGDDIPDLKCMRIAGLACAPHDASHEALETATYISRCGGGYGCARDIIEQTMRAQGKWPGTEEMLKYTKPDKTIQ